MYLNTNTRGQTGRDVDVLLRELFDVCRYCCDVAFFLHWYVMCLQASLHKNLPLQITQSVEVVMALL
jgi:hypothetical protein